MAFPNFEYLTIDWHAADLFGEFTRFRDHVQFMFAGLLSELNPKRKAGWLGTWIGTHGCEVYKMFTWEETEKDDAYKILDHFETYVRPRKNKRIARHRLEQQKQKSEETFF